MIRVLGWPAFRTRDENPYNALLYTAMRGADCEVSDFSIPRLLSGRYDVWHIHWPERYFALPSAPVAIVKSVLVIALVYLARLRSTAVVWTIHNLQPHERRHPRFAAWFWSAFTRRIDAAISLSEAAKTLAVAQFPAIRDVHHAVTPAGDFRGAYPPPVPRAAARRALGIADDTFAFIFIGKIRPYKNLDALVDAFTKVSGNVRLVIAGHPADAQTVEALTRAAGRDPRIVIFPRHVPPEDVPRLLAAADLAVLPYTDILNSGAALLALSFGTPVLLPNKGSVPELAEHFGPSWVRTFPSTLTPDTLSGAQAWVETVTRPALPAALAELNWTRIATLTRDAYTAALAGHTEAHVSYAIE